MPKPIKLKCSSSVSADYWSKRMVPIEVVEKLVEALKYYADERENERKVNVCEFNENLNRMYVCGDGSGARKALAAWEKYKESMK